MKKLLFFLLALSIGLPNIAQEAMETIEVDFPQPEILSDFSRASDWTIEIAQADFEPLKVQAMTIPAGPELMSGERIPSSLVLEIQTATPQITTVHLLMSESLTIEESAVSFNLWVQGSNRSHWISVLLVDENGAQHKLPLKSPTTEAGSRSADICLTNSIINRCEFWVWPLTTIPWLWAPFRMN
jgi:hypothetical protein